MGKITVEQAEVELHNWKMMNPAPELCGANSQFCTAECNNARWEWTRAKNLKMAELVARIK